MSLYATHHGVQRYQAHHPGAGIAEIRQAVEDGFEVPKDLAATMLGRYSPGETTTRYVLAPDLWGMFAIDEDTVVTYLRFGDSQHQFAVKHWGESVEELEPSLGITPEPPPVPEPAPKPPKPKKVKRRQPTFEENHALILEKMQRGLERWNKRMEARRSGKPVED